MSWQLDPTEGPGRVRKRLMRCHLGIEKRFLTPENQAKLGKHTKSIFEIFYIEDLVTVYRVIFSHVIFAFLHLQRVSPHFEFAQTLLCLIKQK